MSIANGAVLTAENPWRLTSYFLEFPLRLLHAWASVPVFMFLLMLTAMLFRPPDLKSFPIDRIALALLLGCVALRVCARVEAVRTYPATWPLLLLTLLAIVGFWGAPFQLQSWSLLAAKWIVPLLLFHISGVVFKTESNLHKLELFSLGVLLYLSIISIFFLFGFESLIFPKYILDPSIGIHVDRARGPFLQAVANGVCLNILGLVALNSFCRGSLLSLGMVFFTTVPLALLATKTRAVWISAAFSIVALVVFCRNRKIQRAAIAMSVLATLGLLVFFLQSVNSRDFAERLRDQSPVDFRGEIYSAGWQMFNQKPLLGWGDDESVQGEMSRRVSNFHPEYFVFHNTFLELAVQRGIVGLGLYGWLIVCLFRVASGRRKDESARFLDAGFRSIWPVILGVYLINASAVVMNYQFVNGLLFTFAGILAAQRSALSKGVLVEQQL